jgi:hypothetical protein
MRRFPIMASLICFASAAMASNTIRGLVRNESRGEPAVGDAVFLVRLGSPMQEEARAKTDAQGAFALNVQYPGQPYLVRVVHQRVNYEQGASAGDSLSIQVFDASPYVPDITGTIEIFRAGTKGRILHVSDMYEIKNASSPPVTKAGQHTFEVYLPANAKIDSVLAAGPEKIVTMISATPFSGEPGHYSVNFPLRPGASKFAFNYDLPYDAHVSFQTRHAYPLQHFKVMIPSTMKFSSGSPSFETLASADSSYQVKAASQLRAGEGPGFEISGRGAIPHVRDQTKTQARSQPPVFPNSMGFGPDCTDPPSLLHTSSRLGKTHLQEQSLLWAGVSCLFLVGCALILRRVRKMPNAVARGLAVQATSPTQRSTASLDSLKNNLFQLETDRIRGSVSGVEYASARQALEEAVKRAIARL